MSLGKSDFSQALLHYSFGAFGNDTVSQLVLGHRHMAGHGVPQNCPTAVSYYNAAAERVIELGRMPGTLPYIEKVRLSVRSQHGLRSAREQQWLQFYQYSADMGDVDAQTAVGQLFNRGARGLQRDHQQALHYFRWVSDAQGAAHILVEPLWRSKWRHEMSVLETFYTEQSSQSYGLNATTKCMG